MRPAERCDRAADVMARTPEHVTAWDLVARYGTGGMFQARRPGGRVIWTDARQQRRADHDDFVILGRLESILVDGQPRLRVIEQRVPSDAPMILLDSVEG